jgi:AbrB family looped-hinge helix DNA binding protein
MSDTATLSSKFQISIPKSIRVTTEWKPGQKLVFIPRGKSVMVVPELKELRGIARGADPTGYRDREDRY